MPTRSQGSAMKRPRFTIASLLGVVLLVAMAFAALREATDLWDGGVFMAALAVLLVSVLLAVHRRDDERAFWLGFALFGSAYLIASLIPRSHPGSPRRGAWSTSTRSCRTE